MTGSSPSCVPSRPTTTCPRSGTPSRRARRGRSPSPTDWNSPRPREVADRMETTVRDNPEESRYEIRDGDHVLGVAAYERRGDTTVFTHTTVDPDVGENGLGSTLVRAAL